MEKAPDRTECLGGVRRERPAEFSRIRGTAPLASLVANRVGSAGVVTTLTGDFEEADRGGGRRVQ